MLKKRVFLIWIVDYFQNLKAMEVNIVRIKIGKILYDKYVKIWNTALWVQTLPKHVKGCFHKHKIQACPFTCMLQIDKNRHTKLWFLSTTNF